MEDNEKTPVTEEEHQLTKTGLTTKGMNPVIILITLVLGILFMNQMGFFDGYKDVKPGEGWGQVKDETLIPVDTEKQAEIVAGFELDAPDTWKQFTTRTYAGIRKDVCEFHYLDDDGNEGLWIRKSVDEDLTGLTIKFDTRIAVEIDGTKVFIEGPVEDSVQAVTWTDGEYYFGILITDPQYAITRAEAEALYPLVH